MIQDHKKVTIIPFIQVKYLTIWRTVEIIDMPQAYFDRVFKRTLCEFPWNFQNDFPKLTHFEMERTECLCCNNITHKKINYQMEYIMRPAVPGFWLN